MANAATIEWQDDEVIAWLGENSGCVAKAITPLDRQLVVHGFASIDVRGVKLVDQDGQVWASAVVDRTVWG